MGIQINGSTDRITAIDGTIDFVSNIGNIGLITASRYELLDSLTIGAGSTIIKTTNGQLLVGIDNAVASDVSLQIHSATSGVGPILNMTNNSGDCRIFFGQDSSGSSANAQGQIRYNVASNYLSAHTSGAEKFRITSGGQLRNQSTYNGSSSSSNDFPCLNLNNLQSSYTANNILGGITFGQNPGHSNGIRAGMLAQYASTASTSGNVGAYLVFRTSSDGGGDSNERLRIDSSGNVGINQTSPNARIEITDTSTAQIRVGYNQTKYARIGRASSGNYEFFSQENGAALIFGTAESSDGGGAEKMRIDRYGYLSFAGDTNTYIHHPSADQLAITRAGGSTPLIRFGTGGSGVSIGINTTTNLVTNSEVLSVRGYSSFKSNNKDYAALYVGNEGNTTDNINALILFNDGGANRSGIGYVPNTGEFRINNQYFTTFCTGASSLGGTERLRITASGLVGINTSVPTAQLSFLAKRSTQTMPPICFQTAYGASLADAAISTTDDTGGTDIMMGSNVYMGQNGAFVRYYNAYGSAAVRCQYTGKTIFYNKSGNNAPEESMRIDGTGYLGINQTSPSTRLDVKQNNGVAYNGNAQNIAYNAARFHNTSGHTSGGTYTGFQFNISGDSQNRICSMGMITEASNSRASSLVFHTDDSGNREEKMRIDSVGRVTKPKQPRMLVKINSTTTLSNSKMTNWSTAMFNVGSLWDESNKRIVAPIAGAYLIGGNFRIGAPGLIRVVRFNLQHYTSGGSHSATYGGGIGGTANHDNSSSGYDHPYVSFTNLIYMDAGSYVELHCSETAVQHTSYIQVSNEVSHLWAALLS